MDENIIILLETGILSSSFNSDSSDDENFYKIILSKHLYPKPIVQGFVEEIVVIKLIFVAV